MDINATSGYGDENWNAEFKAEKDHIIALLKKPHGAFLALQYIMTSFFNLLGRYNESYRMGSQASIENVLSDLQQYRNAIETDFDACQQQGNTTAAGNAIDNRNKIIDALNKGEAQGIFSKEFVQSVEQQLNTALPKDNKTDLANAWYDDWSMPGKNTGSKGAPYAPTNTPQIQGVTNALTALSTDFSSQSSIAQSKLKYYETWDEQFMTVQHSMMSEYINQEKSPNTSMQSAAS